jgi:hypothetical protein
VIVDCDRCEVRGVACGDCVIGVLLDPPARRRPDDDCTKVPSGASTVQLDAPERRALAVLADQGLVPGLRLVATDARRVTPDGDNERSVRDVG